MKRASYPVLIALMVLAAGCPRRESASPEKGAAKPALAPESHDPAVDDIPFDADAPDDPSRLPHAVAQRPLEASVRYILVSHKGAEKAASSRTPQDAEKRAWRLTQAARKRGADFVALAKSFSDAPEATRGTIEVFAEGGGADPDFLAAALSLGVGQVSDPIHTPFGYYVLERVKLEQYASAHILVMYLGAQLAPPGMKRTKEEARELIEKIAAKAAQPDASFATLASRYSDSPSKLRGGVIAPIRADKLLPGFEPYFEALKQLHEGEVSSVVETPFGFHLIKRLPLQKVMVRYILIAYKGAATAPREPRSKTEAEALANAVLAEARRPGADFAALAAKYSDSPAAARGGLLPPFARGEMEPRFEQYAFALKQGEISDVIENRFGYQIIQRMR